MALTIKVDKHILRYMRKWKREHQIVRREGNPSNEPQKKGEKSPSVFTVSGGLPTLGKRR
jgi:hypothetical protein